MAAATLVITYDVGVADGKEAVVTSLTVGGSAYGVLSATEIKQAYFLSKGVEALLVKDGKMPIGVNGQLVA